MGVVVGWVVVEVFVLIYELFGVGEVVVVVVVVRVVVWLGRKAYS